MNDIKQPVIEQVKELEERIGNYTCTIEKAQADYDRYTSIMKRLVSQPESITDKEKQFMSIDNKDNDSGLIYDIKQLEEFKKTLSMDLVKIETDYAIVSEKLFSPAGFHPSSRIFNQPKICIHTNNPKQKLPDCNVKLYLVDLRKCA